MSATMTNEQKHASAVYLMPEATIGLNVLWFPTGVPGPNPFTAVVTSIGGRTVDLAVYAPSGVRKAYIGVRHHTDPQVKAGNFSDAGAWGYTDETMRQRDVEDRVKKLEAHMKELE